MKKIITGLLIVPLLFTYAQTQYNVEKSDLSYSTSFDVTFDSVDAQRINVLSKIWKDYTIKYVLPHGTKVKAGDVIISFDDTSINNAITSKELTIELAKIQLKKAKDNLKYLKKVESINKKIAELTFKAKEEDLKYYQDVTEKLKLESYNEDLKFYQNSLKYAEEELKQLQKMYKEDGITEESEEIVLFRQKESVRMAKKRLDNYKKSIDFNVKISVPRTGENLKLKHQIEALQQEIKLLDIPESIKKTELETVQKELLLKNEVLYLEKLMTDKKQMTFKAAKDGIVYHGSTMFGISTQKEISKYLKVGSKLISKSTLLSVISLDSIQAYAKIPADKIKFFKNAKLSFQLNAKINSSIYYKATLKALSEVPDFGTEFMLTLSVEKPANIYPGMKGKLYVTLFNEKSVLNIPNTLIKDDESDRNIKYVFVKDGNKSVRRNIKIGLSNGLRTIVTEGLKESDVLYKSKK